MAKVLSGAGLRGQVAGKTALSTVGKSGSGLTYRGYDVKDLAEIIFETVERKLVGETIECVGPEVLSFKEIIFQLLKSIYKKRLLINMPLALAKVTAKIFELMPKPLLTTDQLNLLKYDNVTSGKYKTNFDLSLNADRKFESEIEKYSFNWRSGGQFSKKNISSIK